MLTRYHQQITTEALGKRLSPTVLKTVIRANLHQDDLKYLLGGYPHYHFDDSEFERTHIYLNKQHQIVENTLAQNGDPTPAWIAFGKITHTVQDFYAHSNYVHLWLEQHNGETSPDPNEIEPLIPHLITHPRLFTARSILILEFLGMIPLLGKVLIPFFPPDTHIRMNLDQPTCGPLFSYAFIAARKRTEKEFEALSQRIHALYGSHTLQKFVDIVR
jgi:hypothetical protein